MSPSTAKVILILGASYGGISTAHYLLKHAFPSLPHGAYKIVLVSPSTTALCRPACPRALLADDLLPQDKLFVSIAPQFAQYAANTFEFVQGTATSVDHEKRTATIRASNGETGTLAFDALVIATGATTPSPLLGLASTDTALREAWAAFRVVMRSAKHIVVAGGGPTGVEVAGELGDHLNGRHGANVAITLVTSSAGVLPSLRHGLGRKAAQYLGELGVSIVSGARVERVEPAEAGRTMGALTAPAVVTLASGETLQADLFVPAMGTQPNTSFLAACLVGADGRVTTNARTLRVEGAGERVYAIGDASSYARAAIHTITAAVPVLGENVKRDLVLACGGEGVADREFAEDERETQLVPVGRARGVGAAMGWRMPSWVVWLVKGRDYWSWTVGRLWSGRQW